MVRGLVSRLHGLNFIEQKQRSDTYTDIHVINIQHIARFILDGEISYRTKKQTNKLTVTDVSTLAYRHVLITKCFFPRR